MRFFKKSSNKDLNANFDDQISQKGLEWLIANVHTVKTELLQFVEPGFMLSTESAFFLANMLAEFNHDIKLAVIFGEGKGHAFFNVAILKRILNSCEGKVRDVSHLGSLFVEGGYKIKKVNYIHFEDNRNPSSSTVSDEKDMEKIGLFTVREWRELFLKMINEDNENPFAGQAKEHLEFNKKTFPEVIELAKKKFGDF